MAAVAVGASPASAATVCASTDGPTAQTSTVALANSALCLVTAFYYPPRHNDINFKRDEEGNRLPGTGGIFPDIEVKQSDLWKTEDFKDKVHDTQLQKALEFLRARQRGMTTAQAAEQVTKPR